MPSAIVTVAYRVLPESPRFLSIMGRHDEAVLVRTNSNDIILQLYSYTVYSFISLHTLVVYSLFKGSRDAIEARLFSSTYLGRQRCIEKRSCDPAIM